MTAFGVATKVASALGVASIALEAHDMGKRHSRIGMAEASANKLIADEISISKLNSESAKHGVIKKFLHNFEFTTRMAEAGGATGGYFSGAIKCIKNNIFTVGFGMLGLFAKSKPVRTIALAGMGISILFDTIVNATGLFERKDYLEK